MREIFARHAKHKLSGEPCMNLEDFTDYISGGRPAEALMRDAAVVLFHIADRQHRGRITYTDFVIFEDLLCKPDAEYRLLFKIFDVNSKGRISLGELKKGLAKHISIPNVASSEWLRQNVRFGESDTKEITYGEFSQIIHGITIEQSRYIFNKHDTNQSGTINPDDFKSVIEEVAGHHISSSLKEVLPTVVNLYDTKEISYTAVQAFCNLLRNMDLMEDMVNRAIRKSADKRIGKMELQEECARSLRQSPFTPMEIDMLLHFAGLESHKQNRISQTDVKRFFNSVTKAVPDAIEKNWNVTKLMEAEEHETGKGQGGLVQFARSVYNFALGSIAGAVGAFSIYPIDLVKTRMQNQRSEVVGEMLYKNSLDCFQKVIRNEGVLGLYSGLLPQLVGVAPEKAIKLTMNDLVRGALTNRDTGYIPVWGEMLAGCSAGASQVVFTNPLEIVKIRLQVQGELGGEKKGAWTIIRSLGLMGLYKGSAACLLRDVPFSAVYFTAYSHLKKDLFHESPRRKLSIFELLSAGAIAGIPAAYFTTPADVIKTRLQVEARQGQVSYNGLVDAAKKIYRNEGFRAFFKGGPARVFRSSPQFGVTLMSYELLQQALPFPLDSSLSRMGMYEMSTAEREETFYRKHFNPIFMRSMSTLKLLLDVGYKFDSLSPKK